MKKTKILNVMLLFAAFGFLILSQQACVKEYADFDKLSKTVDYSPTIAGAIAHTKLTVRDIIRDYDNDELFEEGADGFLFLMYDKRVFTENAENLISLPNQSFPTMDQYSGTIYNVIPPSADNYRHFNDTNILYDFIVDNQEQLDSIQYDQMDIRIQVNSTFQHSGILIITFPALVKNGTPFTTIVYPDATGSFTYDLTTIEEDYTLILDVNRVLVDFDLKLQDEAYDGNPTSNSDQLDITIQMNNMDFRGIYGYVGRINTVIPQDTINISIFDNAFNGAVYFQDPSMTLYIDNSIGMPINTYMGDLHTFSTIQDGIPGDGTWNSYDFPLDELEIAYPTTVGETAHQQEVLDVVNFPEIRDVISSQPKYLFFEVDSVTLNPNGYDHTNPNFILDDNIVSVNLEVKLPLWGNALYSLVDTLELNIEESFEDISKHFVEANMRTIFDNFLPTNVYAQIIFTDSLYFPIDTLFNDANIGERLIESAILDTDGRAEQAVKKTTDILYGNGPEYEHDINDLERVKYAIIIATLKTNDVNSTGDVNGSTQLVKFYGDNYIEVKFGVKGQGKYEGTIE